MGDRYIIDPTILEELCSQVTLTVGVNKDGQVCGIQKSVNGSIDPSLLTEMIQVKKGSPLLTNPLLTSFLLLLERHKPRQTIITTTGYQTLGRRSTCTRKTEKGRACREARVFRRCHLIIITSSSFLPLCLLHHHHT